MGGFKSKKDLFQITKGFYGRAKNAYRIARMRGEKSLTYRYIGRKLKKRDQRTHWIQGINAGCREYHIEYNRFIHALKLPQVHIDLDRKMLSTLAVNEPLSFKAIVDTVKEYGELKEKYYHANGYVTSSVVRNYIPLTAAGLAKKLAIIKTSPTLQQRQQQSAQHG